MKIGNIEIKNSAALAPMAGVADCAFRELCASYGAAYTVTEMVSSKGIHYNSKKSAELMELTDKERPSGIQIFGNEPKTMADAAVFAMQFKPDFIDINMGCPARKIISNGDGSALLNNFELAKEIIESCVNATDKPITVKFRIGYEDGENFGVEFAKMCERAGASAITVHGRTMSQGYSGKVNYEVIAEIKKAVNEAVGYDFPLVLHGSSSVPAEFVAKCNQFGGQLPNAQGVPEDMLNYASKHGVAKINIDTDLRLAMTSTIREFFVEHPEKFDPREYMGPGRTAVKEMVIHKMRDVLGTAGHAQD